MQRHELLTLSGQEIWKLQGFDPLRRQRTNSWLAPTSFDHVAETLRR